MENGTYAFEAFPEGIDETLEWIARELKERYGVRAWFAEILGKRWSYRAGVGNEFPTPLEHIMITPRFGMVVEGWEKIPEKDRSALLTFLRGYLTEDKAGGRETSP